MLYFVKMSVNEVLIGCCMLWKM